MTVLLTKLDADSRNLFVVKLKESFDAFAEGDSETAHVPIISAEEINVSLDRKGAEAYWALIDGERVGGIVVNIDRDRSLGDIELLFVMNGMKSKSIGTRIVEAIEKLYEDVEVWELYTPYIETRNIHFYVNKCGYTIVEFFNPQHPLIMPDEHGNASTDLDELFFRFEKRMK